MKRHHIVLLAGFLFSSACFSQERKVYNDGYVVKVGDYAPDFISRKNSNR